MAPNSGDMLLIVARSARPRRDSPGPWNSTNLPTTPCARSISVTVSTRSVAVRARRHLAVQPEADHDRHRLVERLAQQRRLGLDAAHAPAHHAQAVDHGRVRVGPDQRVREGDQLAVGAGSGADHVGQELQVDLVHDAGARRHDPEVVEGLLRPAQEGVALAVALVLALHVDEEGGLAAVLVDLHAVVDHQVGRHQRVDARRVAAHLGHRVAHGRQVDHARHAGEVLQDDPARHERELDLAQKPMGPRTPGRGCHRPIPARRRRPRGAARSRAGP